MYNKITLIIATTIALAACSGKPTGTENTAAASATATPATVSEVQAASSAVLENNAQLIESSDKVFRFTPDVSFSDKLNESSLHPQGMSGEQITLLQYDESRNLTLTAAKNGTVKGDNATLFNNIKKGLQSDKTLSNLVIDDIDSERIDYRFDRKEKEQNIGESCITLVVGTDKVISTICASSSDLNAEDVHEFLTRTVKIGV